MKSYCNCPNCGQGIELHAIRQRPQLPAGFTVEPRHTMESAIDYGSTPQTPPGYTASKRTPTRAPSIEADVKVPLFQSLIGGTLAHIIVWGLIIWSGDGGDAVSFAGIIVTWFVSVGLAWMLITRWIGGLMVIYEEITNDVPETKPHPVQPQNISLHIAHEDQSGRPGSQKFLQEIEGVTEDIFIEWANATLNGVRGLSESDWTGRGKPFSKAQYKNFMTAMGEGGIVAWNDAKHPAQGRHLTNAGRRALIRLLSPTQ